MYEYVPVLHIIGVLILFILSFYILINNWTQSPGVLYLNLFKIWTHNLLTLLFDNLRVCEKEINTRTKARKIRIIEPTLSGVLSNTQKTRVGNVYLTKFYISINLKIIVNTKKLSKQWI